MVFSGRITFDDHKEYDLSATFADHAPQWISHRAQNSKERRLEETSMSLRLVNDTIEKINASLTRVRLSHIVYLGQLLHAADQVAQNSLNRLGRVSVLHFPDDVDGHDDQVGRSVGHQLQSTRISDANRAAFEKVFTVCVTISASAGSTTLRVQVTNTPNCKTRHLLGRSQFFPRHGIDVSSIHHGHMVHRRGQDHFDCSSSMLFWRYIDHMSFLLFILYQ